MALGKIYIVLCLGLVTVSSSVINEEVKSYDEFKVFTVILNSRLDFATFEEFKTSSGLVADTWKEPTALTHPRKTAKVQYYTDVLVAPENVETFLVGVEQAGFSAALKITDVGKLIDEQTAKIDKARAAQPRFGWTTYYRYDEILNFVNEIVDAHPTIATLSTIATSTEGRPVVMVKISNPGSLPNKNAILIDGGFHAREWISPAIVTYIMDQVLNGDDQEVLDAIDLYLIPVINPDGYEYSHTRDRMWRKTRSQTDAPNCKGADPNRNFDFFFGGLGTSSSPCSVIYTGKTPFSEPETAGLRDVILDSSIEFKSYLTIHSYGQWWLTPWSYKDELPEDYDDLMRFGNTGASALTAEFDTKYEVGATTEILGPTAGCADDWAKAVGGVKYANTIEVRDTGTYGFLLPEDQILDTCIETWAGIRAVCLFDF